ncbi:MAG: hypothetical protein ACPGTG_07185 [Flavobacteriales bacterium]
MFVPYSSLSDASDVWLYFADRPLDSDEISVLESQVKTLCENWAVHGSPLNSSFQLIHNQLLVLFSEKDEQQASGCSIDSSVRAVQSIGQVLNVDFFNRWNVYLDHENGLKAIHINKLKKAVLAGEIEGDVQVYKPNLASKAEFETQAKQAVSAFLGLEKSI